MTAPKARPPAPRREKAALRPCSNGNFLVDLGDGTDPRAPEAGFCEVVFPQLWLEGDDDVQLPQVAKAPRGSPPYRNPYLVLCRAATGAADLQRWWTQARADKAVPRRTVTVELLADDAATTVMRWRFEGAYPVGLLYSPLSAQSPGLLLETLTLAFASVDMD